MTWLKDTTICGQEIKVREGESVYRLGPGIVLEDSVIDLTGCSSRDVIMLGGSIDRCEIGVPKSCRHIDWTRFKIRNCRFVGDINEHRFGNDIDRETPSGGELVDCDFSDAVIWDAIFLGVDMGRVKMPSWPTITLLRNNENKAEDYGDIAWPDDFGGLVGDFLDCDENATALCFDGSSLVPDFVNDIKVLRAFVEQQSFFL